MQKDISVTHVVRSLQTSYDAFISRFESQLGRHDISAYSNLLSDPNRVKDVEAVLHRQEGANGFMLFSFYDHGALLSIKGSPRKARQYIVGNPLLAAQMTQHDIRAALYAPLRVLVYADDSGGTSVEYDLPSSLFGQFKHDKVNEVAEQLDRKLSDLVAKSS